LLLVSSLVEILPLAKKKLEIFLEQVPRMSHPGPAREQYQTPAGIAADMVFTAYSQGSIAAREILDLGCGTGVLGMAAAVLGARHVLGVDCEKQFLESARGFAKKHGLSMDFLCADVEQFCLDEEGAKKRYVTVQNPPFGAQFAGRGKDRVFLTQAFRFSDEVYSLHKAETAHFLQRLAGATQFRSELLTVYSFPLPYQFHFHRKEKALIEVGLFRFTREGGWAKDG